MAVPLAAPAVVASRFLLPGRGEPVEVRFRDGAETGESLLAVPVSEPVVTERPGMADGFPRSCNALVLLAWNEGRSTTRFACIAHRWMWRTRWATSPA